MELFEQIRREYEYGAGTIKGVARKFGVHWSMVREALGDSVPRERKINRRGKPRIEPAKAFIDAILLRDENEPRKQRHTAHRIWTRICQELPQVGVAESSIRRYVRERKMELNLTKRETFIPQSYAWGQEAQVDWYEAFADFTIIFEVHRAIGFEFWNRNRAISPLPLNFHSLVNIYGLVCQVLAPPKPIHRAAAILRIREK